MSLRYITFTSKFPSNRTDSKSIVNSTVRDMTSVIKTVSKGIYSIECEKNSK